MYHIVKFGLTKLGCNAVRVELLIVMRNRTRNGPIEHLVVVLSTVAQQLLLFEILVHIAVVEREHRVFGLLATRGRTLLGRREVDVGGRAER